MSTLRNRTDSACPVGAANAGFQHFLRQTGSPKRRHQAEDHSSHDCRGERKEQHRPVNPIGGMGWKGRSRQLR